MDAKAGANALGVSGWRLAGSVIIVVVCFFLGTVAAVFAAEIFLPGTVSLIVGADGSASDPIALIALLSSFIGALIGLSIAKWLILRRTWTILTWALGIKVLQGIAIYGGLYGVIIGALGLYSIYFGDVVPNISFEVWIKWLPVMIPLIFIQVSAEELLFRGLIQRVLFDWSKSRWVWMVIPSVAFGAMHFQPTIMGENAWLMVVATGVFGLLAAEVTFRTQSIGPAIGLHFVNNLNAFLIIQLDSGIGGIALYKTPFSASDTEMVRAALLQGIGLYALFLLLAIFVLPRFLRA